MHADGRASVSVRVPSDHDIQLGKDPRFERRWWLVQRISWVVMGAFVLAALLGAFGQGWMSSAKRRSAADEVEAEYERFPRLGTPFRLQLRVKHPFATAASDLELRFPTEYLECFDIEVASPMPLRSTTTGDGIVYAFARAEPSSASILTLRLVPIRIGRCSGQLEVGGAFVELAHFVYP